MTINRDLANLVPTITQSGGNVIVNDTSTTAKFAVKNDTNDGTYSIKIYGVVGPSATYLDSEGGKTWGTGSGEFQIQNGTSTRPAILSLGGTLDAGEGVGVINFFRSSNTDNYRARAQIAGQVTATGTADQYGGLLAFRTAADGSSNTSERMRIAPTGELLVGKTTTTANGGVLQVSNGITFPATQSASSDANTLDDYEEGTFTVTYTASSGSFGAITYTAQDGYYVKIGRVVFFNFTISTSAVTIGTASSELRISGFPFTVASSNQAGNSTFAGRSSSFTGEEPFAMSLLASQTYGELYYKTSVDGNIINSAPNDLTTSGSGNTIVMNGFYYV